MTSVEIKFNPSRLEAIAACKVINIFYSIQCIVRKYRYQLCFCHEDDYCNACQISSYMRDFYKCLARRDFKTLVSEFNKILRFKNELIKRSGYKIICFDNENELAFFASRLPILTDTYCTPREILF